MTTPQTPGSPSSAVGVTDAMVDAYLTTQRAVVEEADRMWGRPNAGGLHTNTVRESCRQGIAAALAAISAPAAKQQVARPWKDAQEVYDRMKVLNPLWNAYGASREAAVATALAVVAGMLDDAAPVVQAAEQQPAPGDSLLTINGYQLRDALEFLAPDGTDEQLEQEVSLQRGPERTHDEGTDPAGLFCWLTDYPEEGSMRLDDVKQAAEQQAGVPGDYPAIPAADLVTLRIQAGFCDPGEETSIDGGHLSILVETYDRAQQAGAQPLPDGVSGPDAEGWFTVVQGGRVVSEHWHPRPAGAEEDKHG